MFFLGLAIAALSFALYIQLGTQSNFVGDEMGLSPGQQGVLESWRESCGIFSLALLALLAGLAEPLVGSVMLVLFAAGLASYAFVDSYFWLVVASMVWSQGLHVWMPLPNSMALGLAEEGKAGHRLGQLRAAGAIGSGAGLVGALVLYSRGVAIRPLFLVAGVAGIVAAVAILGVPRNLKTPGPRLVIRRRYWLYYLLSFLEGWRKQIFVAFAGFLLVYEYGVELDVMLKLWIGIQAISFLAAPPVGRLIDRVGERKVLVFYFACLTLFFVGYAFVGNIYILYVLYVVDSAFFVFAVALTTYVSRIAPPSEHTPTLSMGVTMNHVAAVAMPLVGALLWKYLGHTWVFLAGALAAAVSVGVSLLLPRGPGAAERERAAVIRRERE